MSKTSYPLKLPTSVKSAAQRLAREDGVSLISGLPSQLLRRLARSKQQLLSFDTLSVSDSLAKTASAFLLLSAKGP